MKVRNMRSVAVQIAATGQVVAGGAVVDVDDELAAGLLEQPDAWSDGSKAADEAATQDVPPTTGAASTTPTRRPRQPKKKEQ